MIFFRHPHTLRPTRLSRLTAWLGVALLGLLVWLSADSAAHERLHRHEVSPPAQVRLHPDVLAALHRAHAPVPAESGSPAGADHCVICDFAAGATDLAVVAAFVFLGLWLVARLLVRVTLCGRAHDFFRHAPSCGPPVAA